MLIRYARVSKSDGSQPLDLQLDALIEDGVSPENIYQDESLGKNTKRPGLDACLLEYQEIVGWLILEHNQNISLFKIAP